MKIAVKVGTSTLTYATGNINLRHIEKLCRVLSDLKNAGNEIMLISSGAIGLGAGRLGLRSRPSDMPTKQAAAAVGQCELMYTYDREFSEYGHTIAQVLLTGSDIRDEERSLNFRNTVNRLFEMNVLPVINENDTVSTEEISVGDNDTLAAIVSADVKADMLILLSDIDGLYTADPRKDKNATVIHRVEKMTDEIMALGGAAGTDRGTGGMKTKLNAAKICMDNGIDMVIANGAVPEVLYDIIAGNEVGTFFCGKENQPV